MANWGYFTARRKNILPGKTQTLEWNPHEIRVGKFQIFSNKFDNMSYFWWENNNCEKWSHVELAYICFVYRNRLWSRSCSLQSIFEGKKRRTANGNFIYPLYIVKIINLYVYKIALDIMKMAFTSFSHEKSNFLRLILHWKCILINKSV